MSSIADSRLGRKNLLEEGRSSGATVPASIAALLATSVALAIYLPHALVLPAMALASVLFASACGLAGWLSSGRTKSRALTAAGVFAIAAIAAAVIGDPDQVAIWLK